eukprot:CAMPEP_0198683276 /NCGR_PEP_ID=MMETSP1468-20131203/10303_1 /TAXON_ID=1461545 /ORGANISM="Mantoniella sp, Strain CCMP1436" /LENGTH=77 /DNA_ID=CAMNT_0044427099 /DNA_START=468 /DNA_END=702 /DNA_ORIENTATION=-
MTPSYLPLLFGSLTSLAVGLLAVFDVGLTAALPARLALMKDQTPVPWRLSVAPTAYRDASNAVLMDQKIGMFTGGAR